MDKTKNIRLILAYDGTHYCGWQRQKGVPTIQETLEGALRRMIQVPVTVIASGRTDTGVHALYQVCHFRTDSDMDPGALKRGLNSLLPDDIHVKEAGYCPLDFHSRYSVKSKTYEYRILNRIEGDVFLRAHIWHVPMKLDLNEMKRCCSLLLGKQDFSCFRSSGSRNVNPVRDMMRSQLELCEKGILHFIFEADGFLRHMVRNMVGTIVEVGRGKRDVDGFKDILASKDRRKAGQKAPPQGLFLTDVRY